VSRQEEEGRMERRSVRGKKEKYIKKTNPREEIFINENLRTPN
jgi:hypothetical protein